MDELIRATKGAHNVLLELEELEEAQLDTWHDKYEALAELARENADQELLDTETNLD